MTDSYINVFYQKPLKPKYNRCLICGTLISKDQRHYIPLCTTHFKDFDNWVRRQKLKLRLKQQ